MVISSRANPDADDLWRSERLQALLILAGWYNRVCKK